MKWIDSYLDQGQLENISLSSVNNPNLKLSHLIFSLVNNPKLKLNQVKVDEHSSDLFAVPHQADLNNWESNNTLPIEKKNQRYSITEITKIFLFMVRKTQMLKKFF